MKKLVCDRCGREVTDREEINAILLGADAWRNSVIARGEEPRGYFPCKDYRNCGGEMIEVEEKKILFFRRKNHSE